VELLGVVFMILPNRLSGKGSLVVWSKHIYSGFRQSAPFSGALFGAFVVSKYRILEAIVWIERSLQPCWPASETY
jgi:hypothetical protein